MNTFMCLCFEVLSLCVAQLGNELLILPSVQSTGPEPPLTHLIFFKNP